MSIAKVSAALETRLGTLTPALDTAYENRAFKPVADVPYQRVNLIPARTFVVGLDLTTKQLRGIFQVSLCYPLNGGRGPALARAELLFNHFPAGLKLIQSGIRVHCDEPASIASALIDGDRYVVPVSIRYLAFIS